MTGFDAKVAVITGGAHGIGKALAARLATLGALPVIADIAEDRLDQVRREFADMGLPLAAYACDVGDDAAVAAFGAEVLAKHGVPDLVFNNAYVNVLGGVAGVSMDDWHLAMNVNVLGYVRVIKAFAEPMIARGTGHVVITASPMGIVPYPAIGGAMLPYIVSKAADIGLAQGLSIALKPHGVGVSLFFPAVTSSWAGRPKGDAPDRFVTELETFIRAGMPTDQAADLLLAGVARGDFCIAASDEMPPALRGAAAHGLDPWWRDLAK